MTLTKREYNYIKVQVRSHVNSSNPNSRLDTTLHLLAKGIEVYIDNLHPEPVATIDIDSAHTVELLIENMLEINRKEK